MYLAPDLLIGSTEKIAVLEDTPRKVFDRISHAFAIPALPDWAEWIYQALKSRRQIIPLVGKGASGASIRTSEEALDEIIAKGVKKGAIRF